MRSGMLNNVVVVQERRITNDPDSNEPIETWVEWRQLFAKVEMKRGREFFEQGQRFAATLYKFSFHYHDIDGARAGSHRIVFEGRTFDITGVLPDFARRYQTEIEAIEKL